MNNIQLRTEVSDYLNDLDVREQEHFWVMFEHFLPRNFDYIETEKAFDCCLYQTYFYHKKLYTLMHERFNPRDSTSISTVFP